MKPTEAMGRHVLPFWASESLMDGIGAQLWSSSKGSGIVNDHVKESPAGCTATHD